MVLQSKNLTWNNFILGFRKWDIELSIPRVEAEGIYNMEGTIPPNLDLGRSTGDERYVNDKIKYKI